MFMQQMASDIFVRILRGMETCRTKPAQPANGTLSWMTPSETLLSHNALTARALFLTSGAHLRHSELPVAPQGGEGGPKRTDALEH